MKASSIFSRLLHQFLELIYTDKTRRLVKATGCRDIVSGYYWQARFYVSDQTIELEVAGVESAFHIQTYEEFTRFQNLAGERPILEEIISTLDHQDVLYDIGANVGTYTCFAAAKLGPNAIVSFEPEPKNRSRLQENLDLNGLSAELQKVALSDSDGSAELALAGDETGEGEHSISTSGGSDTLEVPMAKGDTVVDRHDLPAPTVVKIDVEGAELAVLRGLRNTLEGNVRLVYVEVHPSKLSEFGDSAPAVSEFLENLGYEVTEISQRGDEVFLRASR